MIVVTGGLDRVVLFGYPDDDGWTDIAQKESLAFNDHSRIGIERKSFSQVLCRLIPLPKFKLPLWKSEIINGELSFIFSMWRQIAWWTI